MTKGPYTNVPRLNEQIQLVFSTFGSSGAGKTTWGSNFIRMRTFDANEVQKTSKIKSYIETFEELHVDITIEFVDHPGLGDEQSVERSLAPLLIHQIKRVTRKFPLLDSISKPYLFYGFYFLVNSRVNEQDKRALEILSGYMIVIPLLGRADSYRSGVKNIQQILHDDIIDAIEGRRKIYDEDTKQIITKPHRKMNIRIMDIPFPSDLVLPDDCQWEWKFPYPVMGRECTYSDGENSVTLRWDDMRISATLPLRQALLFTRNEKLGLQPEFTHKIPVAYTGSLRFQKMCQTIRSWNNPLGWQRTFEPYFWLYRKEVVCSCIIACCVILLICIISLKF